jgi:hypothetical protein
MAGAEFHSLAKLCTQMCTVEYYNRTADCHRLESKFESELPQACPDRMYSLPPERGDCLDLNLLPIVSIGTLTRDTIPLRAHLAVV